MQQKIILRILIPLCIISMLFPIPASGAERQGGNIRKSQESRIVKVYSDRNNRIHIIYASGEDKIVAKSGTGPKLGPDGCTVGWLDYFDIGDPKWNVPPDTWVSQKLIIWKDKKIIRTIESECANFIRNWKFWNNGQQVAIYAGGLRFGGCYELYDITTKKKVASCEDPLTENSPEWARGLEGD